MSALPPKADIRQRRSTVLGHPTRRHAGLRQPSAPSVSLVRSCVTGGQTLRTVSALVPNINGRLSQATSGGRPAAEVLGRTSSSGAAIVSRQRLTKITDDVRCPSGSEPRCSATWLAEVGLLDQSQGHRNDVSHLRHRGRRDRWGAYKSRNRPSPRSARTSPRPRCLSHKRPGTQRLKLAAAPLARKGSATAGRKEEAPPDGGHWAGLLGFLWGEP
jgi:hypothetical protein